VGLDRDRGLAPEATKDQGRPTTHDPQPTEVLLSPDLPQRYDAARLPPSLARRCALSQHDDVSWPLVERIAKDCFGSAATLDELCFLAGGLVNTTVCLRLTDGTRAVLKVSPHRVNHAHEREARELALLGEAGLPVPKVHCARTASLAEPHSYVMMEWVDAATLREARPRMTAAALDAVQRELARYVATLHAHTADVYGRFEGGSYTDWPAFYHSLVDPVLEEADKLHAIPTKCRKVIGRVHERLDRLLAHGDGPRLLHGDLWSANVMVRPTDDGGSWTVAAFIDPECRWGHAECEIAYLDLFKTITPAFKQAYQQRFRLPDLYHRVRKPVYQLYGLLNQLQLRGPEFAKPVVEAAERMAAIV